MVAVVVFGSMVILSGDRACLGEIGVFVSIQVLWGMQQVNK